MKTLSCISYQSKAVCFQCSTSNCSINFKSIPRTVSNIDSLVQSLNIWFINGLRCPSGFVINFRKRVLLRHQVATASVVLWPGLMLHFLHSSRQSTSSRPYSNYIMNVSTGEEEKLFI